MAPALEEGSGQDMPPALPTQTWSPAGCSQLWQVLSGAPGNGAGRIFVALTQVSRGQLWLAHSALMFTQVTRLLVSGHGQGSLERVCTLIQQPLTEAPSPEDESARKRKFFFLNLFALPLFLFRL